MADIELVIKIPKAEYELIVNDEACGLNVLTRAIANGTSLDDVLDKISAEIEEIETYDGLYIDRYYVLQIIDKYREVTK